MLADAPVKYSFVSIGRTRCRRSRRLSLLGGASGWLYSVEIVVV